MADYLLRGTENCLHQTVFQGFCPDTGRSFEFTIPAGGETEPVDVTGWLAISWNAQDGATRLTRKLNSNPTGRTAAEGMTILHPTVSSVTFTGPAGTVIEIEGM